ncbi:hypothetical protein BU16DRAFT_165101 [Lophium mytilinum]|uniref:DUF7730 domain-containing protein n=1 Tax=Lophium mytilinum TaxID=390894 RepID=A0A6A6QCN4_9PEZI|nr:hypothetical protein BU16DRAFT_165101 [Lophium mytilinum]
MSDLVDSGSQIANLGCGHFRLLDLPRELRNHIYYFALVREKIEIVENQEEALGILDRTTWESYSSYQAYPGKYRQRKSTYHKIHSVYNDPYVNLFLVNRQVYSEAAGIFYTQNIFRFDLIRSCLSCYIVAGFLKDRPRFAKESMRSIQLVNVGGQSRDTPVLCFESDFASQSWKRSISVLRQLTGLRSLAIQLDGWPSPETVEQWVPLDRFEILSLRSATRNIQEDREKWKQSLLASFPSISELHLVATLVIAPPRDPIRPVPKMMFEKLGRDMIGVITELSNGLCKQIDRTEEAGFKVLLQQPESWKFPHSRGKMLVECKINTKDSWTLSEDIWPGSEVEEIQTSIDGAAGENGHE